MQLTSTDLLGGLGWIALWLAIVGVIVAFSIWRARRHGSTTLALDVTRNASLAYLLICAVGVVMTGVSSLSSASLVLDDSTQRRVTDQQDFLRTSHCSIDGVFPDEPTSQPRSGLMKYCQGWIDNAPFGPRFVIFLGALLGILASAAIAWAIYTATRRASLRDPFHPSVSRTFGIASISVMIAGAVSAIVTSIGMTLAARSLDWDPDACPVPFELSVPLWPFAAAVGLFALSAIFRYGAQLQREKEQLQRETEGLV
ncbi:hypothetical protein ACTJJ4_08300 [Microbacterium sp. 22195]|uniref:hypothetical protein n=1 Tax=Microbacterium sp. 22195 TaxID=3453891 RepID=UPI003F8695AF